jgi:uncharacterized protein (DUF952 family)
MATSTCRARTSDETVAKHFAGQHEDVAAVDLAVLGDAVKWEPARGGALFPHIHAELPLSAVIAHGPLRFGRMAGSCCRRRPERIVALPS